MSAAREAFVQNDAQTVRDALDYFYRLAKLYDEIRSGRPGPMTETVGQRDDALAALDRLEELAT
jgi:hypothetical protein